MPERHLAAAVIHKAVEDFLKPLATGLNGWERLRDLTRRIDAGAFLLERNDAIVHHWFDQAGVGLEDVRSKGAWQLRLQGLKQARAALKMRVRRPLTGAAA